MSNTIHLEKFDYENFLNRQEMDRKRIANELHDTSVQDLTHLIHQIELAGLYIDLDPIKAKLELATINDELRKIIKDIRNTIFDLRPMSFDDLGLQDALEQYIDNLKNKCNVEIETEMNFVDNYDEKKKLIIYRILIECLNNSAKHADASIIKLKVKDVDNNLYLSVTDDGIGILNNDEQDSEKERHTHYGLSIMKERVSILNGKCYINSKEDEGTHIEFLIPREN